MKKIFIILTALLIIFTSSLALVGCKQQATFETITEHAFYNDQTLTSYVVPKSVKKIEYGAFAGCTNLKTLVFEEGCQLESIGASAFEGCSSLESVVIPKSLTQLSDSAFKNCKSLVSVKLPANLLRIKDSAFFSNNN